MRALRCAYACPCACVAQEGLGSDIGQFSALDARGNQSTASIKICTRNQAFLIWINGHLVGTGQDCDLDFLRDRNVRPPPLPRPLQFARLLDKSTPRFLPV